VIYGNINFGFKYYKSFDFNPNITFWQGFLWIYSLFISIYFLLAISMTSLLGPGTASLLLLIFAIVATIIGSPTIWIVDWFIAFSNKFDHVGLGGSYRPSRPSGGYGGGQVGGAAPSYSTTDEGTISGISGMYAGQSFKIKNGEELIFGRDGAFAHIIIDGNAAKVSRKHCAIRYDANNRAYLVTDYSSNGTFQNGVTRLMANIPASLPAGAVISLGDGSNQFRLG
jgi:hypothetical protein